MSDEQTLLKREYLYCNKRRLYMTANMIRDNIKESSLNADIAEDVLELYEKYKDVKIAFIPVGDEFDPFPPTAAGRMYFADSIARVMHDVDVIKTLNENKGSIVADSVEEIFLESIGSAASVMERITQSYLKASGVRADHTPIEDIKERRKYRDEFYAAKAEYERIVKNNQLRCGDKVMEKMRIDAGIPERMPVEVETRDIPFESLIESEPNAELLFYDEIVKMRRIIADSMTEAAERSASKEALLKIALNVFLDKSVPLPRRRVIKFAFFRYRKSVDNLIKRSIDVREACVYYAKCLIKDEPVDRIIYEKIKEHLKSEVDVINDGLLLSEIPGFSMSAQKHREYDLPRDYDSIMKVVERLNDIRNAHPYLFDAQCILSVFCDTDVLNEASSRARICNMAIDSFTKSDEAKALNKDQWVELFEGWIVADAMLRVTYPIMDFVMDHKDDTVGDATEALNGIIDDISYIEAEGHSRLALREIVLERSGYNVSQA